MNSWCEYNDTPNQCRQILNTTLVRFKAQDWSSQWIQQQWIQINKYTYLQIGPVILCEFSHVLKLCDQMRKSWFLCNFSVSISFSLSNKFIVVHQISLMESWRLHYNNSARSRSFLDSFIYSLIQSTNRVTIWPTHSLNLRQVIKIVLYEL